MNQLIANDLLNKKCHERKKGERPLPAGEVKKLLTGIPGWKRKGGAIVKTFNFKDYYETMVFVNATAWVSHCQFHHPDLEVGFNQCVITYSTHSVGGLSTNDFMCAARIEALMKL